MVVTVIHVRVRLSVYVGCFLEELEAWGVDGDLYDFLRVVIFLCGWLKSVCTGKYVCVCLLLGRRCVLFRGV